MVVSAPESPPSARSEAHCWGVAGLMALGLIGLAKLLLHLYASRHYGYYRDELYYLACGDHLDWGYVDQPPLIAFIAKGERLLLGDSLLSIRIASTLAGTVKVLLTGMMAGELGGGRFAQILAAVAALVAPGFLALDSFLSMNSVEALLWTGCAYLLVRTIKTGNQTLWIWFGLLAGVGAENKYSMLLWAFGLVLGLLLTSQRKCFRYPWIWVGGAIAFFIFLPNLWWNIQHHFPFLELQANIRRSGRDVSLSPVGFLSEEILAMNPATLPIWLVGIWFYFFTVKGKPFRALGWAWFVTAVVILILSPRIYYLFPAFPVLFAGGAVALESCFKPWWLSWLKIAYPLLLLIAGALIAPIAIPVLPVKTYLAYTRAIHLQPPAIETWKLGPLPQVYADQFGWKEMVAMIARVYQSIPAELQPKTAILARNYGEAGAIDFFGPKYGLPKAICGHQSYFFWGPRNYTGESMIVIGGDQANLRFRFRSVTPVASISHPYSMRTEYFELFYCRGLNQPLDEVWPRYKHWD
ncbi:MAG: glycosyltransferase family 39 protein [Verrucomicrobia bacterium]|nr:glycosyltransferase family 39 protein [Verrucomicrobiota bacterium]